MDIPARLSYSLFVQRVFWNIIVVLKMDSEWFYFHGQTCSYKSKTRGAIVSAGVKNQHAVLSWFSSRFYLLHPHMSPSFIHHIFQSINFKMGIILIGNRSQKRWQKTLCGTSIHPPEYVLDLKPVRQISMEGCQDFVVSQTHIFGDLVQANH